MIGASQQPFVLRFKRAIPIGDGLDAFTEPGARRDVATGIWVNAQGQPLYATASKPYTTVSTQARTVKGGYTPSGKYKPSRNVPPKMDRRSGK